MTTAASPLLRFAGVSKRFCRQPDRRNRLAAADIARDLCGLAPRATLRDGEFWALRDLDLTVGPGEVLGVIGHNGAGKSTLMHLAAGLFLPTTGTITQHADTVCRIDPFGLMHAQQTGRDNAVLQLVHHGVPAEAIADEVQAIAEFADLTAHMDDTVGTYSHGMRSRLGFAIFSRLRPNLFLVDEALGGGDRRFRNQFRSYLEQYVLDGGAMLLCVHDAQTIQAFCHRVLVLDGGRALFTGDPTAAIDVYNAIAAERGALPMSGVLMPVRGGPMVAGAEALPEVRIREVTMTAPDGDQVVPGGVAVLRLRCVAAAPVDGLRCLVEISRGEAVPLATLESPVLPVGEAGLDWSCRIAALPFAPGRYELRTRVVHERSGRTVWDSWREAPTAFQVRATLPAPTPGRGTVIHLTASWEAEQATPTGSVEAA